MVKEVGGFGSAALPSLPKTRMDELAGCRFVTALARAELRIPKLLRSYGTFDPVLVEELGYVRFSREAAHLLLEFFSDRYETRATGLTTSLPFAQWTQVFGGETMTVLAPPAVDTRLLVTEHHLGSTGGRLEELGRRPSAEPIALVWSVVVVVAEVAVKSMLHILHPHEMGSPEGRAPKLGQDGTL